MAISGKSKFLLWVESLAPQLLLDLSPAKGSSRPILLKNYLAKKICVLECPNIDFSVCNYISCGSASLNLAYFDVAGKNTEFFNSIGRQLSLSNLRNSALRQAASGQKRTSRNDGDNTEDWKSSCG